MLNKGTLTYEVASSKFNGKQPTELNVAQINHNLDHLLAQTDIQDYL